MLEIEIEIQCCLHKFIALMKNEKKKHLLFKFEKVIVFQEVKWLQQVFLQQKIELDH